MFNNKKKKRKEKKNNERKCRVFPYNIALKLYNKPFYLPFAVYPLKDTLSSDFRADSFDDEAFETGNSLLELEECMHLVSLRGLLM